MDADSSCPTSHLLSLPRSICVGIVKHVLTVGGVVSLANLACACQALKDAALEVLESVRHVEVACGTGGQTHALASSCCHGCEPSACARAALLNDKCTMGTAAVLYRCSMCECLNLQHAHAGVTDETAAAVAASSSALQRLVMAHCTSLSHAGLQSLAGSQALQQSLRVLDLNGCGDVGDGSALSGLLSLEWLSLRWCISTTSHGLRGLCAQGRLKHLDVHGCELLDNDICTGLPSVVTLDLAFTRVGDEGLIALGALSPRLQRLTIAARDTFNLWSTGMHTDGGVQELRRLRPQLQVLSVVV